MNRYLFLILFLILFNSCDQYPGLETGLYADIETSKGNIILFLEYEKTPLTVSNFVALAEGNHPSEDLLEEYKGIKYYDGIVFHRVLENFIIQGGDPTATGKGGPGYRFVDEITDLQHSGPGILSMANSGPGTNGSQFFITHKETPWLDGIHTVFGRVIEGQEVVDNIIQNDTIIKLTIIRKGSKAKGFNAPSVFKNMLIEKNELDEIAIEALKAQLEEQTLNMKKTSSGLYYKIIKDGNNKKPNKGDMVSVHYKGMLLDGTIFDSSYERDQPIEFLLGTGQVIPPNATLIFEVELLKIKLVD